MRLSKEDWNKLDELLGKIGFGGYYDLLEVIKEGAFRLCKDKIKDGQERKKYEYTIRKENDLKFMVTFVNHLIFKEDKK